MVGTLPTNGYKVPWRGVAYAQDSRSPIGAPLPATVGAAHDSSGGWMTGGAGGEFCPHLPIARFLPSLSPAASFLSLYYLCS